MKKTFFLRSSSELIPRSCSASWPISRRIFSNHKVFLVHAAPICIVSFISPFILFLNLPIFIWVNPLNSFLLLVPSHGESSVISKHSSTNLVHRCRYVLFYFISSFIIFIYLPIFISFIPVNPFDVFSFVYHFTRNLQLSPSMNPSILSIGAVYVLLYFISSFIIFLNLPIVVSFIRVNPFTAVFSFL